MKTMTARPAAPPTTPPAIVPGGAIGAGAALFVGAELTPIVVAAVGAGLPLPWPPIEPVLAGTKTSEVSSAVVLSASEAVAKAAEKASSEEVLVGKVVLSDRPGMVYIRPSMSVV
jgi:hypothetical protein